MPATPSLSLLAANVLRVSGRGYSLVVDNLYTAQNHQGRFRGAVGMPSRGSGEHSTSKRAARYCFCVSYKDTAQIIVNHYIASLLIMVASNRSPNMQSMDVAAELNRGIHKA